MSTYAQEQNTLREITRQTAALVADQLEGFTVDTSEEYDGHRGVYLDGPNGARLFLALDWRNSDRLEVSGIYPRGTQLHNVERHEIGVRRDRGPAVIAREITRRLLPGYLTDLERVQADNDERATMRDRRQSVARELAELAGGTVDAQDDRSTQAGVRWFHNNGDSYGDVRINYRADSVSIDIRSLPVEVARDVLALIGKAS